MSSGSQSKSKLKSVRSKYHYGFYAAMKVFYDLAGAPVTYEQEKQLGEEPVRLDFLIIKKNKDVMLDDPIGSFFRMVNLCEYKSPEDSLSIDDFYKAQGYGLIYKGFDRKVNELPIEDMTLTLVRHVYPREMIKTLKASGFTVMQAFPGIYRFEGKISIPTQLVVPSQLSAEGRYGLELLSKGCTEADVIRFAERSGLSTDSNIIANTGAVINVCMSVNEALRKKLREDTKMDEESERIVKWIMSKGVDAYRASERLLLEEVRSMGFDKGVEESLKKGGLKSGVAKVYENIAEQGMSQARSQGLTQGLRQGLSQGRNQGIEETNERVAGDMLKKNLPISLIEEISKLSGDTIRSIAENLGVPVVL